MVGFREREGMKSVKNGVWREGKRGIFKSVKSGRI